MVGQDDRSDNDRVFTQHARLMKGGAAGEIIGSGRALCTHVITVASRVTHGHSPVETPSHWLNEGRSNGSSRCSISELHNSKHIKLAPFLDQLLAHVKLSFKCR